MNPAFLEVMEVMEVMEAFDDAPLIPAQAIQLRYHQFVIFRQGIQCRLGLGVVFLRHSGADHLLEDRRTPCRFQRGNLGIGVLVSGGATVVINAAGGRCYQMGDAKTITPERGFGKVKPLFLGVYGNDLVSVR